MLKESKTMVYKIKIKFKSLWDVLSSRKVKENAVKSKKANFRVQVQDSVYPCEIHEKDGQVVFTQGRAPCDTSKKTQT